MAKLGEIFGWFAFLIIQAATIPPTINIIYGNLGRVPPLEMVLMIWIGLLLYLIRGIITKDTLFIVSNAVGLTSQSILLALILTM